jgi:hypothetical protein
MTKTVDQFIDKKRIVRQLDELGVPQFCLAALVGVGAPAFSLWLSHQRALSLEAQSAVLEVMGFLRELRETSKVPVDFSQPEALRPLLEEWRQMRMESEVIRTESEMRERAEAEAR